MTATDTSTITAWLLAQIEADEAVAREATPGPWWAQVGRGGLLGG